jgi:hypothetical protein
MNTADKDATVYYNDWPGSNVRYGAVAQNEVVLTPLTGLAPQHLIDLARSWDNTLMGDEAKRFTDWNVLGFEGGASAIDIGTTGFACSHTDGDVTSIKVGDGPAGFPGVQEDGITSTYVCFHEFNSRLRPFVCVCVCVLCRWGE